jgi:hypothetical protein
MSITTGDPVACQGLHHLADLCAAKGRPPRRPRAPADAARAGNRQAARGQLTRIDANETGEAYRSITPQAMRSPELPAGSAA